LAEADEFYNKVIPSTLSADEKLVSRQAYAGLLWSKQFYHYIVKDWLTGDEEMVRWYGLVGCLEFNAPSGQPPPPAQRKNGRNKLWHHLYTRDVISMPDKWEYPWFATWDLGTSSSFALITILTLSKRFT